MAKITIYTRPMCGYCARAVSLLRSKKVAFEEINAGFDQKKREEMVQRSRGGRTFPQIFIGEEHVGGCDQLLALDRSGKLDGMLGLK